MRAHGMKLEHDMDVLEIVGTGGDKSNSFNISTTASMVISAGGVPVAKHGNRAASSKSGAADCLEALGVKLDIEPEKSKELLEKINICFLFAQKYHTAMRFVAPVRKELGIRTVFNILGPLTNPAGATMQVMGVYDDALVQPLAEVLANLGVKRGMVVYGQDRLDEISACAPTSVCEIKDGKFTSYEIIPEQFGLERADKSALVGGTPAENAEITKAVLKGEKGAKRNAVVMNAGAGLYVAGKAESFEAGVRLAEELIDSGAALRRMEEFVQYSNA
jgi:anthranilate phosphoribosyltransferase